MAYYFQKTRTALWACLCLATAGSAAQCLAHTGSERLCGPYSLLYVCGKLGVSATMDEIIRLCGYDAQHGTSMLGLQHAAAAKGLQAVGMKIAVDELVNLEVPAIASAWGQHFVVVEAVDTGTLMVTDPPGGSRLISKQEFRSSFSGFALLVATDASSFPRPAHSGPDLRLDAYAWDFGAVDQGTSVEHTIKCRNAGDADLVITRLESSCGDCLVPTGRPQSIPPGGEGEVPLRVVTSGQRRGVRKELYISSNDPISPVVPFAVTGYVRLPQLAFSPTVLDFGRARRTDTVSRAAYVPVTEDDGVRVVSVSSGSSYVRVDLLPCKSKERPGYIITATLARGAPLGELRSAVTIISDHPKQPKTEIPIAATIRGDIDLDRESFFLGLAKKGEEKRCAVTVSTVGKDPLKIEKIDNPLPYLALDIKPKVEGKEYMLTATLKPSAPAGNIKGEVTIRTNDPDQSEIKAPVYAYVEEK